MDLPSIAIIGVLGLAGVALFVMQRISRSSAFSPRVKSAWLLGGWLIVLGVSIAIYAIARTQLPS